MPIRHDNNILNLFNSRQKHIGVLKVGCTSFGSSVRIVPVIRGASGSATRGSQEGGVSVRGKGWVVGEV